MSAERFTLQHELHASLADGFPIPEIRPRDGETYSHVGTGGWDGYWPPEDSAVPPDLDWTEAHQVLVLAAYQKEWGRFLEDNQTFAIVWPPRGYLTTDGYLGEGELGACIEHGEEDCGDCLEFKGMPGEIASAQWEWSVTIETYEWEETAGSLEDTESFQFMTTLMDPRDVDYQA